MDIVAMLLEDPRVDPCVMDRRGDYPIEIAVQSGYVNVIKRLLEDPRVDPSVKDNAVLYYIKYDSYELDNADAIQALLLKDPRIKVDMDQINY